MEKPLLLTVVIGILYFVTKIAESKYINKKQEPMKNTVRDTLIVTACVFTVLFLFFHMSGPLGELLGTGGEYGGSIGAQAFIDEPGF
jgi:hypothetical protein